MPRFKVQYRDQSYEDLTVNAFEHSTVGNVVIFQDSEGVVVATVPLELVLAVQMVSY